MIAERCGFESCVVLCPYALSKVKLIVHCRNRMNEEQLNELDLSFCCRCWFACSLVFGVVVIVFIV